MTEAPPTRTRSARGAGHGRASAGRERLLEAAGRLFARRGLEVPNREIVAAAGQHNQSAITYHFASRAGLIEAVRERHQTPIAQHRQQLIARLPPPDERTTRQLVEAHIRPLTAEMLRSIPSHWARLAEMLLADEPLWFGREVSLGRPGRRQWADAIESELLELMVAHLAQLPEPEAVERVALTARFLTSGLARWEHDSEAGADDLAPLPSFALTLTDLAVAMLDAAATTLDRGRE